MNRRCGVEAPELAKLIWPFLLLISAISSGSVLAPSEGLAMSANCEEPTRPIGAKSFTVS